MNEKTLRVEKIKNGTVIDHIVAGRGAEVLRALKGIEGRTVILAVNVSSTRMGKKDVLRIEDKYLAPPEYSHVALVSPDATIVTIRDFEVMKKEKADLPKSLKGIAKCNNPACVSNREPDVASEFSVIEKRPARLKCLYCEQEMRV
ncbi:MAG: aspartate carbamoyltransferase regulatory subunit [Nanoarchaeota archaeon]|nr:aspartate carbamoyltransferase regulatory subunit [Nanoarchaeota archaeon]MBU4301032.1 aspartate carbamoyltransferase regulatory subunit [Nanoarchaeota archaeon]MBU4451716.1 aspartate carbamoyltransferase regulatory subunit [Nanoarchaeota archaeon]MCG2723954.1 aspartate carbamoyltransferase regulatory subunit [archaeon]